MSEQNTQQAEQNNNNRGQQKKKFEAPKREAIVDLGKYKDSKVSVKLMGGRIVTGILKGYDQLMNLVLEETEETLKPEVETGATQQVTRQLGLTVIRGTILISLSPLDGSEVLYIQTN
ncbi:uncharacterized protein GVI51_J05577 [Nakaseomyces glabratus]|uniref:Sm domain-containing protein n=1 Tax=Candida glabrata (strain ATCC 2001 / BCRC 20586 / JCM 3761 / NBRC 0622 / NRRL Y-65 / CBS 138) TaxID=284593 RepID=Q6FP88_CANGA|nr:uncharacterized protein CAGL0J05764g [Nakaseomyces glabratus]KAI8385302.1 LSM domain [Nakaseomyces glabratus]KAI8395366.1 LSM domain [Nakaseomyces glabratus]KAJ9571863.1 U6 snRNP-associated protein Lsm7 [Nakaseomyces glabratus]KTB13457.1 U6 snRNA-associated Sm-like protein LSm7 [Nakaseomyces glabratus]KTB17178.1 U6 snRNA-associated Sm-like protein LSm7 [Nakaseomyces glabratus]|eukprot:XP_447956.1 uncharacterized protein CAGL0J05764g [[Candida] glabrata]